MKRSMKQISAVTAAASAGLLAIAGLCGAVGVRVNNSKSIPLGFYLTSDRPPGKGSYVLLCPPQNAAIAEARRRGYLTAGFCPGGYGYLMKMILAVQGDAVAIEDDGVSVNGAVLPFSRPLTKDRAGRPLARYQPAAFTLGSSEVLLMSNVSGTSFDARYFGPVHRAQIKTVIVPIFTW
jgi:conjugative transfer signal peptidase TraF